MILRSFVYPLQGAVQDTVVNVMARTGLETAALISIVMLGVTLLVLLIAVLFAMRQIAVLNKTARHLGTRALDRSGAMLDSGRAVVDNVEFITRAIRTDVERLNASVKALTERLHLASDRMEERIEEFNALMEVVQSEAEAVFVETAATVRGVTASARTLATRQPRPTAEEMTPAPDLAEIEEIVDVAELAPAETGSAHPEDEHRKGA